MHSRTRTSSTLPRFDTSPRSSPPSTRATTYHMQTRSSGSISLRCTRTPTKESRDAAKTEEYPPCHLQLPLITHPTRACPMSLCIEAIRDPTNTTTVTAAAAVRQRLRTMVTSDPSLPMTSALPYRPATQHTTPATTTWSSLNARCTELQD
jgi:hypothetical protein